MINNISCRFCNISDSKTLYPTFDIFGNNYKIHKCNNCNAFFLAPPPDTNLLDKAYDSSYYGEKEEKFFPLIEKVLDYFRWRRAKRVSKFFKNKAKILDI